MWVRGRVAGRHRLCDVGKTRSGASRARKSGSGKPAAAAASDTSHDIASLGERFLALMIDWIACLLIASLFSDPPLTGLWAYPVLIVEYALFIGLFGQTPGMKLARIRCVSATDDRVIGIPRAFLRGVLVCLFIPMLTAFWDSYTRGLHDKAAGTVVLRVPRPKASDT